MFVHKIIMIISNIALANANSEKVKNHPIYFITHSIYLMLHENCFFYCYSHYGNMWLFVWWPALDENGGRYEQISTSGMGNAKWEFKEHAICWLCCLFSAMMEFKWYPQHSTSIRLTVCLIFYRLFKLYAGAHKYELVYVNLYIRNLCAHLLNRLTSNWLDHLQ